MKKLNLEQMQKVEGGSARKVLAGVGCALGIFTMLTNPWTAVGFFAPTAAMCNAAITG